MNIVGTIEARMGSSRLPGKTLMPVFGPKHLLALVVERFGYCREVDAIWVATSTETSDDAIAQWCDANGIKCFRGSEEDVLDRVVRTASEARADGIVQMGADSAYLDFRLIDELVSRFRTGRYDYVCNDMVLTYPLGIYGHVVRTGCLQALNARRDLAAADREDVVRYIWERPEAYTILSLSAPPPLQCPEIRLTVDYPEDFALARHIYRHFNQTRFTTQDIIALYKEKPDLFRETKGLIQMQAPFLSKVNGYETLTASLSANGLTA